MNTKLLMTAAALALGVAGILMSFLPQEIAAYCSLDSNPPAPLIFQLIGALYLGFAMLNWLTRVNTFGGIYGRPVVIANLMHFAVMTLALVKTIGKTDQYQEWIVGFTIVYGLFALAFGYLFLNSPKVQKIEQEDIIMEEVKG